MQESSAATAGLACGGEAGDATGAEGARAEVNGDARVVARAVRQPLLVLADDLTVEVANPAFCAAFALAPGQTEGRKIYEIGDGCWDFPALRELLEDTLPAVGKAEDVRVEHTFEGSGRRVLMLSACPATLASGRRHILLTLEDVSERGLAEEARRASEERLRRVLETDAVGVLFFDATGTLVDANDVFLHMTGYSREEVEARELTWRRMTPQEWVEVSEQEMRKLAQTGRIGPYEKEYILKDGSRSWMMFAGRQLDSGILVEYCIDISDRKHAEMERELLIHELSHRVKNVFAVIQSMAAQTRARHQSASVFREAFLGRLGALARAHCMLLDTEWQGANLDALVANAVQAYLADHPKCVETEGEPIPLTPGHSVAISMVLHELGTNAAKYGALSHSDGRLRVRGAQGRRRSGHPRRAVLGGAGRLANRAAEGEGLRLAADRAGRLVPAWRHRRDELLARRPDLPHYLSAEVAAATSRLPVRRHDRLMAVLVTAIHAGSAAGAGG